MLGLAFLNAWALWLLPLAAIPIIIHLLNRRRFNTVKWAAMEFLLAAAKRNRRRMRMEQWLILALRTLAILLLVFLVARPEFDGAVIGTARAHHVVCIDDSASMAHQGAASTAFEDACERVHALATRLANEREGDLITIAVTSRPDAPIVPVTAVNSSLPTRVRTQLGQLKLSDTQLDQASTFANLTRLYEAGEGASRAKFYFVTDLRKRDWIDTDGEPNAAVTKWLLARDVDTEHVALIVVGPDDSENLSITEVNCRDRVCTTGLPLTFSIEIRNRGLQTSAATEVFIEFDGRSRTNLPVPPLGAGERATLEFSHTFHAPGDHGVIARLAGDRFVVDDVRAISVDVRDNSRVLLVDGDPGNSVEESETYYLHAALEIRGEINTGIEVRLIGEHELGGVTEADLSDFDMVWLCNVARPNQRAFERLESFVRGGGGLAVYLGNQIDLSHYNKLGFKNGNGLMPARLLEVSGDIDDKQPVHLAAKDDPMFATNTEQLELMFEKLVSVGRYITIEDDPANEVLLRIRDDEGAPLLVSRDTGDGRVFVFTSTADAHWTSMPVWPVFVMTTVSMHRAAARPQDYSTANLSPDSTMTLELDIGRVRNDASVRMLGDDTSLARTFTAKQQQGTDLATLTIPMTELEGYGLFEIELSRHDGSTDRHVISRNSHAEEGALERLSPDGFARTYPDDARRVVTVESGSAATGKAAAVGGGGGAWWFVGLAMLIGMMLETILAWRFGRRA